MYDQRAFLVQIFSYNENGKSDFYKQYVDGILNATRLLNVYKPKKGYEIVEIQITPTLSM